jgi:uncharacterized protein (TIGR02001 family)
MIKTNSLLLAGVLSATLMTSVNVNAAEEAAAPAAAPASPHTLTANVGLYSDYLFRGVSYAKGQGAIQGGFDYSHSSGIYLGVWATNVHKDSLLYENTVELDLYGGYVHQFTPDLSVNVGLLQFYYPDNQKALNANQSLNTTELNAAVTYKFVTLKHSYSLTDYFGANTTSYGGYGGSGDSKGTGYTEINASYAIPQLSGLNVTAHVGHLKLENYSMFDYTDINVGVNKDFEVAGSKGWNASLLYSTSDADSALYTWRGYNAVQDTAVFALKRTF